MSIPNNPVDMNFFFRDFVSEDIVSIGIGWTWLYFFKETLIGVRHSKKKVGFFVKLESTKALGNSLVPTIEFMTEEHINDAVNEIDRSEENTQYLDYEDMLSKAKEMVCEEMADAIDKALT